MSKRLFIWIGLIVMIGVIAAAGWSLYTTINRPAAVPPPRVARGKIPRMPATASGKIIHRAPIPDQAPRRPAVKAAPANDAPEAVFPEPSARLSPGVTLSSAKESTTRTKTIDPVRPVAVPEAAASDESPAIRSRVPAAPTAPATDASQAPSDTPAQAPAFETPSAEPTVEPAAEPAIDSQTIAQAAPDQAPASPQPATARTSPPSPAPAAQEPAQPPPPKPQIKKPFTIQVGAYRNKVYAQDMLTLLTRKGYKAYLFKDTDARSRAWYTVRIGRFATRQAAQWTLSAYRDKERKEAIITKIGIGVR